MNHFSWWDALGSFHVFAGPICSHNGEEIATDWLVASNKVFVTMDYFVSSGEFSNYNQEFFLIKRLEQPRFTGAS